MAHFNAQLRQDIRQTKKLCYQLFHGDLDEGDGSDGMVRGARRFLDSLPSLVKSAVEKIEANLLEGFLCTHFDGRPLRHIVPKKYYSFVLLICQQTIERSMELATLRQLIGEPLSPENTLKTFDSYDLFDPKLIEENQRMYQSTHQGGLNPKAERRLDQAVSADSKTSMSKIAGDQGYSKTDMLQNLAWVRSDEDTGERMFRSAVVQIRALHEMMDASGHFKDPEFAAIELANYIFYSFALPVAAGNPVEAFYASKTRFYKSIDKRNPTYPSKADWQARFRHYQKNSEHLILKGKLFDPVGTLGYRSLKGAMDVNRAQGLGALIVRFLSIPLRDANLWLNYFITNRDESATPELFPAEISTGDQQAS